MIRPEDIPEDVREITYDYFDWIDTCWPALAMRMNGLPQIKERFARALLAYGQRRADEATERAARVCEEAAAAAANHDANAADPLVLLVFQQINTMLTTAATAIRSQK